MRFNGKSILITGGAGEIGYAVARRFAQEGARVLLTDAKADALEKRRRELGDIDADVHTYNADITDAAAIDETIRRIEDEVGRIDFLFNNAGYQGAFKKIHEYPLEDFRRVIEINLVGAFTVLSVVSRHMVDSGSGVIVNTASMAGVDGPPNMAAYGASKFGVIGLTLTAAKDLAPYNIRVNAISPAFMGPGYMWNRQVELQAKAGSQYFDTDPEVVARQMIGAVPMRRYGGIAEIPGTVAYLMSEESSYVTGVNIPIAGGIR
ncbi:MAG: SDR family oxidoreductase [Spirochaetales bacterium]|nr:SDR family oxidoreductase [Spirochaetales bacterium]